MAAKQKADQSAYQKLKQDISAGELGCLYIFHGEEAYLRDHYLGRMKQLLIGDGMAEFNLHSVNGAEFTVQWLERQWIACP